MIKKNLFVVLFVFVMIIFANFAISQSDTKKTPEEIAEKKANKMRTSLSLTDDQYKQVYNLILSNVQEKFNNKEKFRDLDKETKRRMKSENRENFNKQMSSILTPEQLTKYNDIKGKHKHKGKNKDKNKVKSQTQPKTK